MGQKKTNQRKCRELALQILFKLDCLGKSSISNVDQQLTLKEGGHRQSEDDLSFSIYKNLLKELIYVDVSCWEGANHLVEGVLDKKDLLDGMLERNMNDAGRLSYVDRNIIRIGLYEMSVGKKPNIVINEAIEVAKTYSTTESSKLVNRVLDQAKASVGDR